MPSFAMLERQRAATLWVMSTVVLFTTACGSDTGAPTLASPDAVPPVISMQPADHAVLAGEAATFRVVASGNALRYRWQRSADSGATWVDVSRATEASFTASASDASANASHYRVVVASGGLAEISSAATLSVAPTPAPPRILVDALPATVTEGTDAVFSVTAAGTSLAYRWQISVGKVSKEGDREGEERDNAKDDKSARAFVDVPGADQPTLRLPSPALADDGRHVRVNVSNAVLPAGVFSPAVALVVKPFTVGLPAFIATQPADVDVVASSQATFSVVGAGAPQPSYQWQMKRPDGTYTNIEGATGSSYSSPPTALADNGATFRVIVSNKGARVSSRAARLGVMAEAVAPTVTMPPRDAIVLAPAPAAFSVVVSGTPTPHVQWQLSRDGGQSFANINGATAARYTTPATKVADSGTRYRVVVSNSRAPVVSSAATLRTTPEAPELLDERSWAAASEFPELSPR